MYKKALIVCGENPVGAAVARRLAGEGYDIAAAFGPGGEPDIEGAVKLPASLEDYGETAALPERAAKALGGLSLCVNAGYIGGGQTPRDGRPDERAYRVNMRAPYVITAAAAGLMGANGVPGSVVNVVPWDDMSLGAERVGRSAALEFSEFGVRVNNVRPGDDPDAAARCVSFFASRGADYLTGQLLSAAPAPLGRWMAPQRSVLTERTRSGGRVPGVFVSGASHGIGRGIARRFAELGYDVAFTYSRRAEGAEKLADYIRSCGVRAFYCQASFGEDGAAERAAEFALSSLGAVDVCVNNAGITIFHDHMIRMTNAQLDELYRVNYRSHMIASGIFSEAMKKRGEGGAIVNISSIHGNTHYIYDAWYGGMKYALNAATVGWADALASDGITVNAIAPGGTPTESGVPFAHLAGRGGERMPLGRSGRSRDMADCAVFYAESPVTGQLLIADGGFTVAGVSEDCSPAAGYGWSRLRRRWDDETVALIEAEAEADRD